MRAASGSTQMLYSAAGVTLPSQHGAPPMTTQRPIFCGEAGIARQRQRDIGQRPERHQRQAGRGVGEAQDRVDRVFALGRAARRRIAAIAEAVAAVKPVRVLVRAQQRRGGADEDGDVDAGDLGGQQRVARRLFDADVAGDNGQPQHAHVGRGKRHQDRDGVVGGGVGVDEEIAHGLGRSQGVGERAADAARLLPSTSRQTRRSKLGARSPADLCRCQFAAQKLLRHTPSLPSAYLDCDVNRLPASSREQRCCHHSDLRTNSSHAEVCRSVQSDGSIPSAVSGLTAPTLISPEAYPFCLPLFTDPDFELIFERPVTILTGENGVGKSTLLEGIASLAGYDEAGGGKGYRPVDHRRAVEAMGGRLANALAGQLASKVTEGWFFRAESFFSVARYLDQAAIDDLDGRRLTSCPTPMARVSFAFSRNAAAAEVSVIFDEPESTRFPRLGTIQFLKILRRIANEGGAQVIMATHSPLLMAYPDAQLLTLSMRAITPTALADTEHFRLLRQFYADPVGFLQQALHD